jgi:alpha-D-ribose 1-methylphosphonate 5-triphosphate synthase subunit PhnH
LITLDDKRGGFLPGLSDPILDSQRAFRAVLGATSHPGRLFQLNLGLRVPAPLHPASAAVALTLFDFETPLWTDLPADSDALEWIRFHCGCPVIEEPAGGRFVLITSDRNQTPLGEFNQGTDESPGDSATLILQVGGLTFGRGRRLTGPGIEKENYLEVAGLPEGFWEEWRVNHSRYPLGVDVILTAGSQLAALPRTSRAE